MADIDPADAVLATLGSSSTVADVGEACPRAMPRISGAAVTILSSVDARRIVHASDDIGAAVEEAQFEHGEGPCFQAFRTGVAVFVADLRAAACLASWPGYVPAALQAGAVAVAALPITAGERRFAMLDLYRGTAGEFTGPEVDIGPASPMPPAVRCCTTWCRPPIRRGLRARTPRRRPPGRRHGHDADGREPP